MNTEDTKISAVSGLIAVVLCASIVAMTVTNVQGHGEPLRYGFLTLPVGVLLLWLFGKARAKQWHPALLYVLFTAAVLSFGAAFNWMLWNTIALLMPS